MATEAKEKLTDEQLKHAVVYIPFFGWIPALAYWFFEKDKTLRWHAGQSLLIHAVVAGVYMVALPLLRMTILLVPIAWFLQGAVGVGFVLLMLYMLVQVRNGKMVRIPMVAEWVDKWNKEMKS